MRQRTKVAEWWERRFDDGTIRDTYNTETEARASKATCREPQLGRCTLHHVTRYRLAPLVRLRWVVDHDRKRAQATDEHGYAQGVAFESLRGLKWWAGLGPYTDASTFAEAKAACAARLRELGYRVVDE